MFAMPTLWRWKEIQCTQVVNLYIIIESVICNLVLKVSYVLTRSHALYREFLRSHNLTITLHMGLS